MSSSRLFLLSLVSIVFFHSSAIAKPYEKFNPEDPRILMAEMIGVNADPMGIIDIHFDGINDLDMTVNYNIHGAPKACKNCIIAVHRSFECHDLGRHLFKGNNINNPWKRTKLVTDENGNGNTRSNNEGDIKPIRIPQGNRLDIDENAGHAVVIYDNATNSKLRGFPTAVACGKLRRVRGTPKGQRLHLEESIM